MASSSLHIVMFPWLGFGHMLPYLELSKSLAYKGHRISYISTPRNIQRLPTLPPQITHLINFIPFNLPETDGLRAAAEATTDLPPEEVPYLMAAMDGLKQPFAHFIKHLSPPPDWIVRDFPQHWISDISIELGIPCIYFVTFSAAFQVYYTRPSDWSPPSFDELLAPPPWITFPSKIAYKRHELLKLIENAKLPNPSGTHGLHRGNVAIESSEAIAIRSCNELESKYLCLFNNLLKKHVLPVGLLPPAISERNEQGNDTEVAIMKWLDQQSARTVVYIALGSEVDIGVNMLNELALGLEDTKLPFIWALRKSFGLLLPEGFEARTKGMGMVVMDWVPQTKILAHGSVRGFLTHCGWSSIIEGIQYGCPLVMLPINHDQGLNARLMEENGMGVEVERNDEDGLFTRDDVAKAVRLVMVDDEGEVYRNKATEMMGIVASKECQDKYVDDFVQFLVCHRSSKGN